MPNETLGVVGESGCGKSTLGRVILGLLPATEGEILYNGESIFDAKGHKKPNTYKDMQMIFQDPFSSLNPRLSIHDLIAEPIHVQKVLKDERQIKERILELMDLVGLSERYVNSYPHELDGGRRQRIGIARALALNPKFIVCDEPVSALDVSVQSQILNLFKELQRDLGVAYLFIAHGMPVVRYMSDRVGVMYLGRLVEVAECEELFTNQLHPYSQALMSAIPVADPDHVPNRIVLEGDVPNPIHLNPGCRFYSRCPRAGSRCQSELPELREVRPGHYVACHLCQG